MQERAKFMARLAEAREAGLVDLKFFFKPNKVMKKEEIFGAMNEVEEAVKDGTRHKGWSGNAPA